MGPIKPALTLIDHRYMLRDSEWDSIGSALGPIGSALGTIKPALTLIDHRYMLRGSEWDSIGSALGTIDLA